MNILKKTVFICFILFVASSIIYAVPEISEFKVYRVVPWSTPTPPVISYDTEILTNNNLLIWDKALIEIQLDEASETTVNSIQMQVYNQTNGNYYNFTLNKMSSDITSPENQYLRYRSEKIDLLSLGFYDSTGFSDLQKNEIQFYSLDPISDPGTKLNQQFNIYASGDVSIVSETAVQSIYFTSNKEIDYTNYIISDSIYPVNEIFVVVDADTRNPFIEKDFSVYVSNVTSGETIVVPMSELGENYSNIFYNKFSLKLGTSTSQSDYRIKALYGDELIVVLKNSNFTSVPISYSINMTIPETPNEFLNIKFQETDFFSVLERKIYFEETLFIEAVAKDANYLTPDTVEVYLTNYNETAVIILEQSQIIDGYAIFRNEEYSVHTFTDTYDLKTLAVGYDSEIRIIIKEYPQFFDVAHIIEASTTPVPVNQVRFRDASFTIDYTENFVRPTDNIYLRIAGQDQNPYTKDIINAYVWSEKYNDTIIVKSIETENNSGLFRSEAIRLNFQTTSTGDKKIRTDFYDTIYVCVNDITAKLYTARPRTPTDITTFYFSDNNYNEQISGQYIGKDGQVYITLFAEDLSPLSKDTITVYLKNISIGDSINFELVETGENSGKYISNIAAPQLSDITVNNENYLKADYGDTIVSIVYDEFGAIIKSDTVYVTFNKGNIEAYDIRLYKDAGFTEQYINEIAPYSEVYVKLWGADENPLLKDVLTATVTAVDSAGLNSRTINIDLIETTNTSGIYTGMFKLNLYTDDIYNVIRASKTGEIITVKYEGKTIVSDTMLVREISAPIVVTAMNLYYDASYDPLTIVDEDYEFNFEEYMYIELIAYDSNPLTQDIIEVIVSMRPTLDSEDEVSVSVQLQETGKNTGIFRNTPDFQRAKPVRFEYFTNDTLNELRVEYGYSIVVKYMETGDSVHTKITVPHPPLRLNELYFYTNTSYNDIIPEGYQQIIGAQLYMQMTGLDANPRNADYAEIYLIDVESPSVDMATLESSYDSIAVHLQETDRNTGIYRGTATLARESNQRFREIGTWEGRFVIILAYNPETGVPDTYGVITVAQYDPPDYAYRIRLMERNNFANVNNYPYITLETANQALYSSKSHLSNIWIEADADTVTASNLLRDTMIVEIISIRGDVSLPSEFYSNNTFNWSLLADAEFCTDHIRDTILVLLNENNGPNSGLYRNYNELTNEQALIRITSNEENKQIRTSDLISAGRSGYLLVRTATDMQEWSDTIVVRALLPQDTGDTTDIYSPEFNPITSAIKELALKIKQTDMEIISMRLYETSSYEDELIYNERSFEGNYDKLYLRVRIEDPGFISHVLYNEMSIRLRNVTRTTAFDTATGGDPILGDGRGNPYIDIKLIETSHSSNVFITDPGAFAAPVARVITKQYEDDFATRTNQDNGELYCRRGDTLVLEFTGPQLTSPAPQPRDVQDWPPTYTISEHRRPNPYRIVRTNASYNQIVTNNYVQEELVYIRALADFYAGYPNYASNPMLRDIMTVRVENIATGDSFDIELHETEPRSEDYRIDPARNPYFRITTFTAPSAYDLAGFPGDTIVISAQRRNPNNPNDPEGPEGWHLVTIADTRIVARRTEPQDIRYIEIKSDASYTHNQPTDQGVVWGQTIYVQLVADEGDPALIDQTWVHVVRSHDPTDTILVTLTQSALGSPYYRGTFTISQFTNDQAKEVGVVYGETLYVRHYFRDVQSPELFVAAPATPTNVNSVFFTNSAYNQRLVLFNGGYAVPYPPNNILYIELNGNDPNPKIADEALVLLQSFDRDDRLQGSVQIKLTETGLSTGRYRNTIAISESTDTDRKTVRGFFGDKIKVTSVTHPNRSDTVTIPMPIEPKYISDLYIKDKNYELNLKTTHFSFSDYLYIEAHGHIGNQFLKDTTLVEVYSINESKQPISQSSIAVELVETEIASGIYRGQIRLADNEYAPSQVQTIFYDPFYDKKMASSPSETYKNKVPVITKPNVEIPVLGNLMGFDAIVVAWPVSLRQVAEEYKVVRSEPGTVYPNPWRGNKHQGLDIRFENLAPNSEVIIYDIQGHLIKKDNVTKYEPAQGYERYYYDWDRTNNNNSHVSSGIYIYIIKDRFNKITKGKLGIIR